VIEGEGEPDDEDREMDDKEMHLSYGHIIAIAWKKSFVFDACR